MGQVERDIRDRAAESLAEIADLDIRPMFSGFGFYVDGLLTAAAWDGAFRLRYREHRHWIYKSVDDAAGGDPSTLVAMVRDRANQLSRETAVRRRR